MEWVHNFLYNLSDTNQDFGLEEREMMVSPKDMRVMDRVAGATTWTSYSFWDIWYKEIDRTDTARTEVALKVMLLFWRMLLSEAVTYATWEPVGDSGILVTSVRLVEVHW